MVFVRPGSRGVEDERLSLFLAGAEERVVDPVRDDVDERRIQLEQLERAAANELARHDHRRCGAGGAVVRYAPERAARRAEELGQIAMLHIVESHDRGRFRRRHGDRERVVHHVHGLELAPDMRDLNADSAIAAMRAGPRLATGGSPTSAAGRVPAASLACAGTKTM